MVKNGKMQRMLKNNKKRRKLKMWPTDGRTDGPTDRQTDRQRCRVAWTRLKRYTAISFAHWWWESRAAERKGKKRTRICNKCSWRMINISSHLGEKSYNEKWTTKINQNQNYTEKQQKTYQQKKKKNCKNIPTEKKKNCKVWITKNTILASPRQITFRWLSVCSWT